VLFLDENKTQSQKAPEGATRCRVLTSGIKVPVGGSEFCYSSRIWRDKQESGGKVKANAPGDRMAGISRVWPDAAREVHIGIY
jgi:hypothetical protein